MNFLSNAKLHFQTFILLTWILAVIVSIISVLACIIHILLAHFQIIPLSKTSSIISFIAKDNNTIFIVCKCLNILHCQRTFIRCRLCYTTKKPPIQPARRQTVVKIKCFFFIFDYILNFMQIYGKRKYNTKKIRKIKYIFVTVTTHTLGCSG